MRIACHRSEYRCQAVELGPERLLPGSGRIELGSEGCGKTKFGGLFFFATARYKTGHRGSPDHPRFLNRAELLMALALYR